MIRNLLNKRIASIVVAVFSAATLYAQSSGFQTRFTGNDDSSLRATYNYTGPVTDSSGEYDKIHAVGGGRVTFTFDDSAIFGSDPKPEVTFSIVARCDGKSQNVAGGTGSYSVSFDITDPTSPKEVTLELKAYADVENPYFDTTIAESSYSSLIVYPKPDHSAAPYISLSMDENSQIGDYIYSMPTFSGATGNWQYECTDHPDFAQCSFTDNIFHIDGTTPNVAGDVKKVDEYNFNVRYFCADPVNNDASNPWLSGTFENIATLYVYNKPDITPQLAVYHLGNDTYSFVTNTGMSDSELTSKEYLFSLDGAAAESGRKYAGAAQSLRTVWIYNHNGTEYRTESAAVNVSKEYTISNSFTYKLEKGSSQPATYQPVLVRQTWHGWVNDVVKFDYQTTQEGVSGGNVNAKFYIGDTEITNGSTISSLSGHSAHVAFNVAIPIENNLVYGMGFSSNTVENAFQIYDPAVVPTIAEGGDKKAFDNETASLNLKANEGSGSNGNWNYSWTRRLMSADGQVSERNLSENGTTLASDNNIAIDGERKVTNNYKYVLHYENIAPDGKTVWAEGDLDMGSLTVYNVPKAPTGFRVYKIGETEVNVMDFDVPETPYDSYTFVGTTTAEFTNDKPYADNIAGELTEGFITWTYPDNTSASSPTIRFNEASGTFTASSKIEIKSVDYKGATNGFNFTGAQYVGDKWYGLAGSDIEFATSLADIGLSSTSKIMVNGADAEESQLKRPSAAGDYGYTYHTTYTIQLADGSVYEAAPLVSEPANLTLYEVPSVPSAISYTGSLQRTESEAPAINFSVDEPTGAKADGWIMEWAVNGTNVAGENSKTYTDTQKHEVSGHAKKIDEYEISLSFANVGPDGSNWITGNVNLADRLKVYNEPLAIGNVTGYRTDESNFKYIACNLGLTDEQLAAEEYDFYYDNIKNSDSRYLPENVSPSQMWTQFVYDDGFTTSSPRTTADNQLKSPTVKLVASADGSGLAAPIVNGVATDNNGFHHCLPGARISLSTEAVLENASLASSAYSINGTSFDGNYIVPESATETDALFRDMMTFDITVDNGVTKSLMFNSGDFNLAKFYPTPVVPSEFSYTGSMQRTESAAPALSLSVNNPSGANAGEWKLQWAVNGNEIAGETLNSYTDNEVRSVDGSAKKIDEYSFTVRYTNTAPNGSVWISGESRLGDILKVYNEPNAIGRVAGYQTDESNFAFIAQDLGLTDEHLSEYQFYYDGSQNAEGRYLPQNVRPSQMWTQFVYDDGFTTVSSRTAAETQLLSPAANLSASADGSGLAAPIVNGVATDDNGFHHCLPGARITLNTTASLDRATKISSAYSANGEAFDGTYTVPGSDTETDAMFHDMMTFRIEVDSENGTVTTKDLTFKSADFNLAKFYPTPVVPSEFSHTGSMQRTESAAPALSLSVNNPSGANAGEWKLQWAVNGNEITGETLNSYTDNEVRSVDGSAKKIDEYSFTVRYTNTAPNGSVWISGESRLGDILKVYNEPNAIGRVAGYQTDESNFAFIAQDLGLTDEHLSEYQFYYDGSQNAEGRYLPQNVRPSQMWTQFVYDDGFTTVSSRTAAETQLLSPAANLSASADGSGLAAPIVNGVATDDNGFHHCLPGARITLNTTASLDRATKISSAYSVNGEPFDGTYTVPGSDTETDAMFHDMMTFRIEVDSENGTVATKDLTFKSADSYLAKFYPTPVYPTLESANGNQKYRDIDQTNYALTTTAPLGANASGWKLQWMRDDTELAGQTGGQYTDTQVYDIPGDSKVKKNVKFDMAFANLAPAGNFNWIEGNVSLPGLTIYNTPTKPERVVTVKYGNRTETFPTGVGVTDEEATQKEYLFSFDGGTTIQSSRYFDGDASRVASVWNYDDFVCASDETSRTADGISEISFSDLKTSATMYISGTISDSSTFTATYTGPVEDAANSTYYAIRGYDNITNSALANLTNGDANSIALDTKTSVMRDGNPIEKIDGLTYSATYVDPGVYTFENIAELTAVVDNNQQHQFSYSVPGTHTINLLALPVFPTPKANADSYFFDDADVINLNASIEPAANGNPSGWSTKWIVDNREVGQDEQLTYPIESDDKTVAIHEVTFSFANKAPVGDSNWIEGENTSFPPIVVFNVPEQPTGIGHFFDEGSQTDSYFAMNTGLTDEQLSNRKYQFCFNDGNGEIINSVDKGRYFDANQNGLRPTTVSSVWVYSTAQGDSYDYTTKTRSSVNSVDEYSFTYNPKLEIGRGNNADETVFPVTEVSVNGLRQALSGVSLTYTPSAEETNGKTLSNLVIKTKLSDSDGSSIAENGGSAFNLIASSAGLYTLEQNVTADITVDNGQNYSINGIDNSCEKVRIVDCPVIETPAVADLGQWRDIDTPDLGQTGLTVNQPAGGNPIGWQYVWSRSDIENIGNGLTLANDENSVNDASESMHSEAYTYSVKYTNISPDEKTVWYTRTVDIAKATVYNTPKQPGSFMFFNSNGAGDDKYIVKNLGLSDEQIVNLGYNFTDNSGNTLSSGSRYIVSETPLNSVRSLWKYEDGYNALSDATAIESTELTATFAPIPNVEKGANDNEAYLGAVRDNSGQFHALEGSDLKLEIELQNNDLNLSDTALKVSDNNGNESEVTPTTDGNKAAFVYRMTDVATYSVSGNIDARYVVDSYNDDGRTTPVYADLKSKTDLSGFSVRTYPTPTLSAPAQGVSSSYKYRSVDNDIERLSVTSAAGGNESWNYTWLKDDVETANTGLTADVDKISFNGNGKEMKSAKYSVRVTDANPVDGKPWYDYTYDVSTVDFYNTPNRPAKLINYVNNGNSTAFAAGVGFNDADLSALEYEFVFDGTNNGSGRSIGNRASEVRTSWKYNDGFVCSSEPTAATETIDPQITASVSITDASYKGYTGSVKDSGENERYYSLPGAVGRYTFNITGKDLSVKGNAIAFMLDNGNTPSQAQEYRTDFNEAGIYDGQISATMVYNAETDQTIDLAAEFGLPTSALVEVLPAPVYPEIGTYVNQFRDVDTEFVLEPRTLPSGANYDGWDYSWTDGTNYYGNEGSATIDIPDMNEDQMQAVKRNITMQYSNSAPNGQKWITGSLDFEAYVYNTPKQPATLTPKGNGTSNIYIVTNMGDNDETLKAKHYQFAFGDGSTPTPEASEVVDIEGRRWYKYESSPSDPWVYSLWKYVAADGIPAYDCYSDATRIGEGSRSEISLRDLYAVDDEEITIFTAGGVRIDLEQTKKLSPGVYVVVHGTGDDTYSEKIVVK